MISYRKRSLKNDIKNCTEKIDRIEEITGESIKTKVEVHDFEGCSTILEQLTKHVEDISQLDSTLNKFMRAVNSKSRDKLNISSEEMSSYDNIASYSLANRRSSSFLMM
ncbi:MAG: hypothetical protein ACR5KV_07625 [Wolbachia sp.]